MASIKELRETIDSNSALVEKCLASKHAQVPSFEQEAEREFLSTAGNIKIDAACFTFLDDTNTLHDMLIGPGEALRRICWVVSATTNSVPKTCGNAFLKLASRLSIGQNMNCILRT